MPDQFTRQDPTTQYPRPPFPPQRQEHPGVETEMEPKPDHGEATYRGCNRLQGDAAIVTGGDSGIGRAVCLAFAREGADVVISYLNEDEDAQETARLVEEAGRRAVLIPGDVQDDAHCRSIVERAVAEFGKLDILVNCAAYQAGRSGIADVTAEELDKTFRTNVFSMFYLCRAALEHMQPGAAIVNTSSDEAFHPLPSLFDYSVTKGAIAVFTRVLAQETIKRGIRVNAVAPGPVWTPILPVSMPPEQVQSIGSSQTPMGRPGQPAEIAPAVVFLASQESSNVNAEVLGVTGGTPLS